MSHISTVHTNIAALFMHRPINSETVTYDFGANSDVKFAKFAAFWGVCSGLVARLCLRAVVKAEILAHAQHQGKGTVYQVTKCKTESIHDAD